MILHANAALSVRQRRAPGQRSSFAGMTITAAAFVVGCSRQTASKWVGRARRGEGLADRSSRPRRSPRRTPAAVEQAVLRARAELRCGPHPLGWALGLAASTVHAILRRHGCSRLAAAAAARAGHPLRTRACRASCCTSTSRNSAGSSVPGHRVTGDRSKRAQGKAGWIYVFAAIDDASRLGFAAHLPRRDRRLRARLSRPPASASTANTGSGSSACSPTTAAASNAAGPKAASNSGSPSARRGPTGRRPTARPSASSAPCSSSGPTPTPTATNTSAPPLSHPHSTPTIASDDTAPSADSHRSSASTTSLGQTLVRRPALEDRRQPVRHRCCRPRRCRRASRPARGRTGRPRRRARRRLRRSRARARRAGGRRRRSRRA